LDTLLLLAGAGANGRRVRAAAAFPVGERDRSVAHGARRRAVRAASGGSREETDMEPATDSKPSGKLSLGELIVFWGALSLWVGVFLAGTLVNSQPYRQEFTKLEGGLLHTIAIGLKVASTYTLTNVCILCLLASLLGMVGAKAQLGPDSEERAKEDRSSPGISALLRGFFVYLALIAGVMVLSETPTEPSQNQYVKLAGLMSLVGFVVNYHPALFGRLIAKAFPLAGGGGAGTKT
jgi:hypothetical protein